MSQEFNAIYVIIDCFSKQIYAILTNTKLTSEKMAKIYQDNVFKLYSILQKVINN